MTNEQVTYCQDTTPKIQAKPRQMGEQRNKLLTRFWFGLGIKRPKECYNSNATNKKNKELKTKIKKTHKKLNSNERNILKRVVSQPSALPKHLETVRKTIRKTQEILPPDCK